MDVNRLHFTKCIFKPAELFLEFSDLLAIFDLIFILFSFLFLVSPFPPGGLHGIAKNAELPVRLHAGNGRGRFGEALDGFCFLFAISHDKLPETTLFVKKFEVEGFDAADELYFRFEVIGDVFVLVTEGLYKADDFVHDGSCQGLIFSLDKVHLILFTDRDKQVNRLQADV